MTGLPRRLRPIAAVVLLCVLFPRDAHLEGDPGAIRTDPPDAWLVVMDYPSGARVEHGIYDSREHAEAALAGMKPQEWADSPKGVVERDSPASKVRVDGVCILRPEHLTVRNNWLARNREWIKPLEGQAREAVAFTWEEGPVDDPLAGRLGGPAPMRKGAPWPTCEHCRKPMTFFGAIDFRGTPEREGVPGDTLTYFQCLDSLGEGTSAWAWLKQGDDIAIVDPTEGGKRTTRRKGTRWKTVDYPFDLNGPISKESGNSNGTVGHSACDSVTVCATKIGGHISWEQGDETPTCECGERMRFVGQFIGGYDLELGDSGIAYIFQCPSTKCGKTRIVLQCM